MDKKEKKTDIRINETDIVYLDIPKEKIEDYKDMEIQEFIKNYGIPFELIEIDI